MKSLDREATKALRNTKHSIRDTLALNRMAARGGSRALSQQMRRTPRHGAWSLPFASIVEMMALGTPSHDIDDAEQIRVPLARISLLSTTMPLQRSMVHLGAFDGEWLAMPNVRTGRVLLFLHGGGYVSGSPASHRALIAHLAQATAARVFAPDYRLAPEHPFPAALEDAWTAYLWLLQQGIPPEQIVVGGDSAGGGLTVALLLALRAAHAPLPAAGFCLSPWFDLALTGASMRLNAATDYLNDAVLRTSARMYLAGHDAYDMLASPLYADLRGLPPLLVQAGTAEMLLDDSRRFAAQAAAMGAPVQLELFPAMIHVWHFTYRVEPQARAAVASIGRFFDQHVGVAYHG